MGKKIVIDACVAIDLEIPEVSFLEAFLQFSGRRPNIHLDWARRPPAQAGRGIAPSVMFLYPEVDTLVTSALTPTPEEGFSTTLLLAYDVRCWVRSK